MALHDPARLSPISRQALREAYRAEENACVAERMTQAGGASAKHEEAKAIAVHLIEEARKRKASGIDAFLHQYGLATEEGVALMCLAEALLRVPDAATADALIRDKIGDIDWAEHMGESSSTFVNAATSLMLTGEVLERPEEAQKGMGKTLKRAVNRLGEPVIRRATLQAMRILGGSSFTAARSTNRSSGQPPNARGGLTHSFDMLGEAAMTFDDAERYRVNYHDAIARLVRRFHGDVSHRAGHLGQSCPRCTRNTPSCSRHRDCGFAADRARHLAAAGARSRNIHFTIDAEEADRLELSLDLIEALARDDSLFRAPMAADGVSASPSRPIRSAASRWSIGLARLARKYDRKFFVRLVKGAYWDTEIKLSHVGGFRAIPSSPASWPPT